MAKLLSIGQAAEQLHVSCQTLRNYQLNGLFIPDIVLESGHRRYTQKQIDEFKERMRQEALKLERRFKIMLKKVGIFLLGVCTGVALDILLRVKDKDDDFSELDDDFDEDFDETLEDDDVWEESDSNACY